MTPGNIMLWTLAVVVTFVAAGLVGIVAVAIWRSIKATRDGETFSSVQIRSQHLHAYKSGEWGDLTGVALHNGRPCYEIRWGTDTDLWPVVDLDADYEFRVTE